MLANKSQALCDVINEAGKFYKAITDFAEQNKNDLSDADLAILELVDKLHGVAYAALFNLRGK